MHEFIFLNEIIDGCEITTNEVDGLIEASFDGPVQFFNHGFWSILKAKDFTLNNQLLDEKIKLQNAKEILKPAFEKVKVQNKGNISFYTTSSSFKEKDNPRTFYVENPGKDIKFVHKDLFAVPYLDVERRKFANISRHDLHNRFFTRNGLTISEHNLLSKELSQ